MKQQLFHWVQKGQPCPVKARVHPSRPEANDPRRRRHYANYVPRGHSVNADFKVRSLSRFIKKFRQRRRLHACQECFFHWDNAPVLIAAAVQFFITANGVRTIYHLPYLPDLAPMDYFLFIHCDGGAGWQKPDPEHL